MNTNIERRIKPRITCNYSAIIQGIDTDGNNYEDHAKLANLSTNGLFIRAYRTVEKGSKLSVTIILTNSGVDLDTPKLATKGIVIRTEPEGNGTCGIAVKFNNYRFL